MTNVSDRTAFESPRMIFRPLNWNDLDRLHCLYGRTDMMKYNTGRPRTLSETRERLARNIRQHARHGFGLYATILKQSGRFIGRCGVEPALIDEGIVGDLAWMFDVPFWNRGLATEFGSAMLEYCRRHLPLHEIFATSHSENRASIRVMQKLGMTFDSVTNGRVRYRWLPPFL